MSVLYSDNDGFLVSHQLFISKLYDTILNKTEDNLHFYEHFFHIHNPFIRDKQQVKVQTHAENKRKRKRQRFEVISYISNCNDQFSALASRLICFVLKFINIFTNSIWNVLSYYLSGLLTIKTIKISCMKLEKICTGF